MTVALGTAVPEQGNLVRVRDRLWVVSEVSASTLTPDVVAGDGLRVDHSVLLTSIEDDGFGEELAVIWQVEPGTEIIERPRLPDVSAPFDEPERLDAFLAAVRWGAITSADSDTLQSPFRSGIEIEDYQLAPLVKALQAPRANLLIADDVGLGKTIEAGLVVQELILRHRVRTAMVLCPPSLCHKWQLEMAEKFGLEFRILDSDTVKRLRRERGFGVNPFTHYPRLIASIDWVKLEPQMAKLAEVLPVDAHTYPRAFDLLIVDEVHTCAPQPGAVGKYATDSLRTTAIRRLAPHFEHRLFLSATPHNGNDESFEGLLALLDPQRFAPGVVPKPDALGQAMIRRLKSELASELAEQDRPPFPVRRIERIDVDYPADEAAVHDELRAYAEAVSKAAGRGPGVTASRFVTLLLKKRLLSSPRAFANTLETHIDTLNRRAGEISRGTDAQLKARFRDIDDAADEDEVDDATEEALALAASATSDVHQAHAQEHLARLRTWAMAHGDRPDAKTNALLDYLDATCRPGGIWNDERVIVFTEFRDTLEFLRLHLTARGLGGDRLSIIHGGTKTEDRQEITEAFQYDPSITPVRILLATDAASEGIDLQRFCHRVVHVEIPFSPTRLEQRNGRVDRHGQRSPEVLVEHFVGRDPTSNTAAADADFLFRIATKVDRIRAGLGSANPLIERQIEDALLGVRRDVDEREIDRAAEKATGRLKRIELKLREEVRALRERLETSIEELGITPIAVETVVRVALELGRQLPLTPIDHPAGSGVFRVPDLTGSWAYATVGLEDPVTDERRPVTFDAEVARGRTDVVHLHLGHPLVSRSLRLLRAQVWSPTADRSLARVAAQVADVEHLTVIAHGRVVITGTDGRRLHEEVVASAGSWANGRLTEFNVGQTAVTLALVRDGEVASSTQAMLADQWERMAERVETTLTRRAEAVGEQRQRRLDRRRDAEIASIGEVLTELENSIRRELAELEKTPEVVQLKLDGFDTDERRQYDRDIDAMRRRLDEIPAEIEREQAVLAQRYEARDVRVFPVAVTFLVPPSLAGAR